MKVPEPSAQVNPIVNSKREAVHIAVIGLGYVGLPLARLFATRYPVVGFDINRGRVDDLKKGIDTTLEVADRDLQKVLLASSPFGNSAFSQNGQGQGKPQPANKGLFCTSDLMGIQACNYFVVTVPTPVDKNHRPVLTPLYAASKAIGKVLKKGDTVIYESTVYPGVTEDECVPVLERESGLKFNTDFFVGYSPERSNPGDKEHTVDKILKITAGSTPESAEKIDQLYSSVITAGTYMAPSIKVAEAAKVIENSQRDIKRTMAMSY